MTQHPAGIKTALSLHLLQICLARVLRSTGIDRRLPTVIWFRRSQITPKKREINKIFGYGFQEILMYDTKTLLVFFPSQQTEHRYPMKRQCKISHETGVNAAGASTANICTFIAVIVFCFLFTPPCEAKTIQTCIDKSGNTVFTDSACPAGYESKNPDNASEKIIRKNITPPPAVAKTNSITWEKYQITLEDMEMSWFLTKDSAQQKSILHPQVEFAVHNSGESALTGMKIIMIFTEDGGKIFGDTSQYIKDIPAGNSSEKTAMYPDMGFVSNGYDEDMITDKKYQVEIYGRYVGDKEKIATLNFFAKTIKQ